jgi:5'-3' exonuclease
VPTDPPSPLLLAVDGNSLLHRAYHALIGDPRTDAAGQPVWALQGMVSFIARAAARLRPDAVLVGFDCPDSSVRRADFPQYKSHRPEKADPLVSQLRRAPELLRAAGLSVVVPPGYEADDVLASCAAAAAASGWRTTVATSDRDAFALIDAGTCVLRILNGGIDGSPVLTPQSLPAVCGVRAEQYRDFAALRGDSSDNLPGAFGIGAKIAARLLTAFERVDDAFAALDGGRRDEVVAAIGAGAARRLEAEPARENVARNQRLMAMRTDLDLPPLDSMRVPLERAALRAALAAHEIHLGPSLWALTGDPPPASDGYGDTYGNRHGDRSSRYVEPDPHGRPATAPVPLGRPAHPRAAPNPRGPASPPHPQGAGSPPGHPSRRTRRTGEPIPGQLGLF